MYNEPAEELAELAEELAEASMQRFEFGDEAMALRRSGGPREARAPLK